MEEKKLHLALRVYGIATMAIGLVFPFTAFGFEKKIQISISIAAIIVAVISLIAHSLYVSGSDSAARKEEVVRLQKESKFLRFCIFVFQAGLLLTAVVFIVRVVLGKI